jgi:hypothetical protein
LGFWGSARFSGASQAINMKILMGQQRAFLRTATSLAPKCAASLLKLCAGRAPSKRLGLDPLGITNSIYCIFAAIAPRLQLGMSFAGLSSKLGRPSADLRMGEVASVPRATPPEVLTAEAGFFVALAFLQNSASE